MMADVQTLRLTSAISLRFAGLAAGSLTIAACAPVQHLQSAAAAGGALVNSVVPGSEPGELSAAELRALQSREFAASKAAGFASVMTVLLDTGYRVLSADLASGLITATGPSAARLRLDPTGLARSSETPLASVFVEERGASAIRVRISYSLGRTATGALGSTGERAIHDPALYAAFFDQLRREIDQRPPAAPPPPPLPGIPPAPPPPGGAEMDPGVPADPPEQTIAAPAGEGNAAGGGAVESENEGKG